MDLASILTTISIAAIPVVFAITVHEVAHGWVAKYFGDRTAEAQGRLSLNPIRHVDPIGTLLVPAILLLVEQRFSVRLGKTRARKSAVHAQSSRQYGLGVGRWPGRQSRNGDHLGFPDDALDAGGLRHRKPVVRSHGGIWNHIQRDARGLQHAADSAAGWRAGTDESASARPAQQPARKNRAFRFIHRPGAHVCETSRAIGQRSGRDS